MSVIKSVVPESEIVEEEKRAITVETTIEGRLVRLSLDEIMKPVPGPIDDSRLKHQMDQCAWYEAVLVISWAAKRRERKDEEANLEVWFAQKHEWAETELIKIQKERVSVHSSSSSGKPPAASLKFSKHEARTIILQHSRLGEEYLRRQGQISDLEQDEGILHKTAEAVQGRRIELGSLLKDERAKKAPGPLPGDF